MKKTIITLCAIIGMALSASAQDAFQQHDKVINIGIGLPDFTDSHYENKLPSISTSFEYCIIDHVFDDKSGIGVGGILGFTGADYTYASYENKPYGFRYRNWILAGRGAFHYQPLRGMDTYLGVVTGYTFVTTKRYGTWPSGVDDDKAESSDFLIGGVLGIRYYLTDNFALMAEAGTALSYITAGIAFKF